MMKLNGLFSMLGAMRLGTNIRVLPPTQPLSVDRGDVTVDSGITVDSSAV